MSVDFGETTLSRLEAALAEHIESIVPGHIVSGYVMQVHLVDFTEGADNRKSRYVRVYPANQPYHETYGLLATAQDAHVTDGMVDPDEDE